MQRYLVERSFAPAWDAGSDLPAFCAGIVEANGDEVTWLHSYVSDDGARWFCIYDAPTPEAVRRSSARNGLPVDSIAAVRVLDPYPYVHP